MKYMSRPQSVAVKDIDIADILYQKYRYRIDIGKGDIDPPLPGMFSHGGGLYSRCAFSFVRRFRFSYFLNLVAY